MPHTTPTPVDTTSVSPVPSTAIAATTITPFPDERLFEFQLPNETNNKRLPNSSVAFAHQRTNSATSAKKENSRTNSCNTVEQPTEVYADRNFTDDCSEGSQPQIRHYVAVQEHESVAGRSDVDRRESSSFESDREWKERDKEPDNTSISESCYSLSTIKTANPEVERIERMIDKWRKDGRFQNLYKSTVPGNVLRKPPEEVLLARWDNEVSVASLPCIQNRGFEHANGQAELIWSVCGTAKSTKTTFIIAENCPADFLIGTRDRQPFEGFDGLRTSRTPNISSQPCIGPSSSLRQLEGQPSTVPLQTYPLQPAPRSANSATTSTGSKDSKLLPKVDVPSQLHPAIPTLIWSVLGGVLLLMSAWLPLVILRDVLQTMLVGIEWAVEDIFRPCLIVLASLAAYVLGVGSLLRRIWNAPKMLECIQNLVVPEST